jgi:parallel beta-helix repeat protein
MPTTIDVRTFGAKGDGQTDDTQALQRAILEAEKTGNNLLFSQGTYIISKRLDFEKFENQTVSGSNATIKAAENYKQQTLEGLFSFNQAKNVKLSGLTFDGNEQNLPADMTFLHGIFFRNSNSVEVSNNTTKNTVGNGIAIVETDNPNIHNNIVGSYQHGGIEFKRANNIVVTDNTITGVGDKGPTNEIGNTRATMSTSGILITGTATGGDSSLEPPHSGARVERNLISNSAGGGIKIEDQNNVSVVGNYVKDFGKDGIKIHPINEKANTDGFIHDAVVVDNVVTGFKNWRGDGSGYVVLQGIKNGRIEGNTILGNNGARLGIEPQWQVEIGIRVNKFPDWSILPENVVIKDNTVWGTRSTYYFIAKESTFTISGNDVKSRYTDADLATLPPFPTIGGNQQPDQTPTPTPEPNDPDLEVIKVGTSANDTFMGGTGKDKLSGDKADAALVNTLVRTELPKGVIAFENAINSASGDDLLLGRGSRDTLIGGFGNDVLDGGTGDDLLYGENTGAMTLPWATAVNPQTLAAADAVWGRAGHDVLDGGIGNDVLVGGSGSDTLYGGFGKDALYGDAMEIKQVQLRLSGTSTRNGPPQFRLLLDGKQIGTNQTVTANYTAQQWQTFTFDLEQPVTAGNLEVEFLNDDWVSVTEDRNLLVGGVRVNGAELPIAESVYTIGGNDTPRAGQSNMFANGLLRFALEGQEPAGDDLMDGGHGDDLLSGGGGNDILSGGLGSDLLVGGAGDDALYALGQSRANGLATTTFLKGYGAPLPPATGRIENTILIRASGDTFNGLPRIKVMVDGQDVSGQMSITALHKDGEAEILEVRTDLDLEAAKRLQVQFTNDAWGGSKDKDRNVYIHGVSINGVAIDNKTGRYENKPGVVSPALNRQGEQFLFGNGILSYSLDQVQGLRNTRLASNSPVTSDQLDDRLEKGTSNVLDGGAGVDTLYGSQGNDTFRFGRGYDQDTVVNADSSTDTTDTVALGEGVAATDLWFSRDGQDLQLSILGTGDSMTLDDWFATPAMQVDRFQLSDGKAIASRDVLMLVEAMSGFNVDNPAEVSALPPAAAQTLDTMIAAVWK